MSYIYTALCILLLQLPFHSSAQSATLNDLRASRKEALLIWDDSIKIVSKQYRLLLNDTLSFEARQKIIAERKAAITQLKFLRSATNDLHAPIISDFKTALKKNIRAAPYYKYKVVGNSFLFSGIPILSAGVIVMVPGYILERLFTRDINAANRIFIKGAAISFVGATFICLGVVYRNLYRINFRNDSNVQIGINSLNFPHAKSQLALHATFNF